MKTIILACMILISSCDDRSLEGTDSDAALAPDGAVGDVKQAQDDGGLLPRQFKGYNLFSWRMDSETWCFTLLSGVDRQRFRRELNVLPVASDGQVKEVDCSLAEFRTTLTRIPVGESVSWFDESWLMGVDGPTAEFPDLSTIVSLTEFARSLGLNFNVKGIDF